ncbi:DNA polymerase III subunit gamma/tau [Lysinibacillus fusiformis]|uniref:DNA polymerase III subunit gamma/tau n=1 Tax=Lysinibacillus fusiformis TaxID=28031 RepID=UPI0006904D9D|nr:DNA polymerase III subunit gamma/tau [Lysinibacillus fusiformis]
MNNNNVVLYRKYRPQGFNTLIGQNHVKNTLENSIKHNKVAHAYLFTGPRGTGKTSTAKIFAKLLNCQSPIDYNPCGECVCCQDSNTDIIEMDAASNNGVDDIRDLREKVNYAPAYGKKKIYIIDEVHMLSTAAFNALLKTLEEPPAHIVFILATTEPHKIPPTILSRCQRYDFRRISQDDIVHRMKAIVETESVEIEEQALRLISQIAAGGMRDALSLLDQAISKVEGKVTLQDIIEITGAVDTRKIGTLIKYINESNIEGALEHFNTCFESGQEPHFFLEEMMIYLRDILVNRKLGEKATLKKGHNDPQFYEIAHSVGPEKIYDYMDLLNKAHSNMKFHNDVQLLMEMTIVEMINNKNQSPSNLQQQIDELKKIIMGGNYSLQQDLVNQNTTEKTNEESMPDIDIKDIQGMMCKDPIGFIEASEEASKKGDDWTDLITEETVVIPSEILPSPSKPLPPQEVEMHLEPPLEEELHLEPPYEDEENNLEPPSEESVNSAPHNMELNSQATVSNETEKTEVLSQPTNFGDFTVENIYLSEREEIILEALASCNEGHRKAFESKLEEFSVALKKRNVATKSLFRDFTIRAVSNTHVLLVHDEPAKVKLLEKDKNKTNVNTVLKEVYQETLSILVCSAKEWSRIKVAYKYNTKGK